MQQPDSRQVGADKPTTQLKNCLGLYLHLEGFDMVGLAAVMDLKESQQELAYYPMSTAHMDSKIITYFLPTIYQVTHFLMMSLWQCPPKSFFFLFIITFSSSFWQD